MEDTLLKEERILPEDVEDLILEDEELAVLEDEESGGGLVEDVIVDEDGDIVADALIDEDESDGDMIKEALTANPERDAVRPGSAQSDETGESGEAALAGAEGAGSENEATGGMTETAGGGKTREEEENAQPGGAAGAAEETCADAGGAPADAQGRQKEQEPGTKTVVGVRFRSVGKSYYFAVGNLPVRRGSHVIVETSRGLDYGTSVCDPIEIEKKKFRAPVKRIVRIATPADENRVREMREKEHDAYLICCEKIRRRNLDMKLISAEYAFDGSKLLFYFTADERVDFRDLVKDLAGVFRTRIELRQIGVRDETRILGGYGICGRPLCCHTYLTDFAPVSIKMAKEQNLSLNPTKISGSCGRLMCCLKNEEEVYEELNKNLPKPGDEVEGSDGLTGEVIGVDILRQLVRMVALVDDQKEMHEYPADQITILRRRKRGQAKPKVNRSELRDPRNGRRTPLQGGASGVRTGVDAAGAGDTNGSLKTPATAAFGGQDGAGGSDAGEAPLQTTGQRDPRPRRERSDARRRSRPEGNAAGAGRNERPAGQNTQGGRNAAAGENAQAGLNASEGRNAQGGRNSSAGQNGSAGQNAQAGRRSRRANAGTKPRGSQTEEKDAAREPQNADGAAQHQRHRRNRRRSGTGNEQGQQTQSGENQ